MVLRRAIGRHPVVAFFLLAYGISWSFWIPSQFLYMPEHPLGSRAPAELLGIAGTFGPFVAAVIVAWTTGTGGELRQRLLRWRVAPRWYVAALGVPVAAIAIAYMVYRFLGGAPMDLTRALPLSALGATFVLTLVAGGGNEEPGWRGFALPRLQTIFGPVGGSIILAVLWAGWHLPAFFDPLSTQSLVPPIPWALGVVATSLVLTWLFNASAESVPVVALYHATFNVAGLWVMSALPVDAVAGFYWTGITVFVILASAIVLVTRAALGFSRESPVVADGGG